MALINKEAAEIHCKLVYYGPSLGGKTTNVQWVYANTTGQGQTAMQVFNATPERTRFFDFLPMDVGQIRGLRARFHLYTVPGQVVYDASRKLIMTGLDGVVFVADSQPERMEENLEALRNLEKNLEQQGYDIRRIPFAIQYNKRDIPGATPIAEMRAALNRVGAPDFEAVAHQGKGVMDTLKTISKTIVTTLKGGEL